MMPRFIQQAVGWSCAVLGLGAIAWAVFAPRQNSTLVLVGACLFYFGYAWDLETARPRPGKEIKADGEWHETPAYLTARQAWIETGDYDQLTAMLATMDGPLVQPEPIRPWITRRRKPPPPVGPGSPSSARAVGSYLGLTSESCEECNSPFVSRCEYHDRSAHLYRKC